MKQTEPGFVQKTKTSGGDIIVVEVWTPKQPFLFYVDFVTQSRRKRVAYWLTTIPWYRLQYNSSKKWYRWNVYYWDLKLIFLFELTNTKRKNKSFDIQILSKPSFSGIEDKPLKYRNSIWSVAIQYNFTIIKQQLLMYSW